MSTRWNVKGQTEQTGPVSLETVQQWLETGRIDAKTRVCEEGTHEWFPVSLVEELHLAPGETPETPDREINGPLDENELDEYTQKTLVPLTPKKMRQIGDVLIVQSWVIFWLVLVSFTLVFFSLNPQPVNRPHVITPFALMIFDFAWLLFGISFSYLLDVTGKMFHTQAHTVGELKQTRKRLEQRENKQ